MDDDIDPHIGCDKMSLCGSVKQTKHVTFRAYDNREREGAKVTAVMHVGKQSLSLPVSKVANESFAYEFSFTDNKLGVGILEVYFNGKQIPESPFRVEVVPRDCAKDYPGKGMVPVSAVCHLLFYGLKLMTFSFTDAALTLVIASNFRIPRRKLENVNVDQVLLKLAASAWKRRSLPRLLL